MYRPYVFMYVGITSKFQGLLQRDMAQPSTYHLFSITPCLMSSSAQLSPQPPLAQLPPQPPLAQLLPPQPSSHKQLSITQPPYPPQPPLAQLLPPQSSSHKQLSPQPPHPPSASISQALFISPALTPTSLPPLSLH